MPQPPEGHSIPDTNQNEQVRIFSQLDGHGEDNSTSLDPLSYHCNHCSNILEQRGPFLSAPSDASPTKFVAAVDKGLQKLRHDLLQAFAEQNHLNRDRVEFTPQSILVKEPNGSKEIVLASQSHMSMSSVSRHELPISKEIVFASPSRSHLSLSSTGTDHAINKQSSDDLDDELYTDSLTNDTSFTAIGPGDENAVSDKRVLIYGRWIRCVQLLVTLGRARFQILPCWVPSSDNVEEVSFVVKNTLGQVGKQRQKVDEIVHVWNVEQNRGLSTFVHVAGSFAFDFSHEPTTAFRRRHPSLVFHPLSTKRVAWSLIGLLCIVYDAAMISLNFFDVNQSPFLDTIDWILRIYWVLDIVISFRTGFYIKARYVDSPAKIAQNYLKTWFAIDVIAVVPDWVVTLLEDSMNEGSSDIGDQFQAFRYLKVLKMLRLVRMAKMAAWLHNFLESLNSINLALSIHILKYAGMVICWVHCCGCMWYAMAKGQNDSWIVRNNLSHLQLPETYFISVQWAFAQLQGNTDVVPAFTTVERAISSLVIMLSIFVLAVFISNITNTLIQLQTAWSEKARQLRALQDYLHRHKVSPDLSETVRKYCAEKLKVERKLKFGEDDVTNMLPKGMRRALLVEVRADMIKDKSPVFMALRRVHPNTFEKICCDIAKPVFAGPDTLVYNFGEECTTTYFNVAGELIYDHVDNSAMGDIVRMLKCESGNFDPEVSNRRSKQSQSRQSVRQSATAISSGDTIGDPLNRKEPSSKKGIQVSTQNADGRQASLVHKEYLRERLHAAGTIIQSTQMEPHQQLCEAVLWTSWTHCGDLSSVGHSAFLVIESRTFQMLVEHDPKLMNFGVSHAVRFCRVLNEADVCSDLLTSNEILDVLHKAGEITDGTRQFQ